MRFVCVFMAATRVRNVNRNFNIIRDQTQLLARVRLTSARAKPDEGGGDERNGIPYNSHFPRNKGVSFIHSSVDCSIVYSFLKF